MKKTVTALLAVALAAALLFAGCQTATPQPTAQPTTAPAATSAAAESAAPAGTANPYKISDEKITLNFAVDGLTNFRPACKDMWIWKTYEDMTNVHIEWNEIPESSLAEQVPILMASNTMPDAFFMCRYSLDNIIKFSAMGKLIALDDLIKGQMPNLSALMAKDASIAKALKMPDGKIYSLPYLESSQVYGSLRYYINQKWLTALNLQAPKTTDELANVLKQFKSGDPNKNGKDDEIPVYMPATSYAMLEQQLLGSFGLGNRGHQALTNWIDMGKDNKVRFIATAPEFKEVLQYEASLWQAGLIYADTFTDTDNAKWTAAGAADTVGLFSWVSPGFIGADVQNNYTGINALVGPHGDKLQSWCDPFVRDINTFVVTTADKYPEQTMKWADFFYGEEGSKFGTLGQEGQTYVMKDGKPQYIDAIMKDERGIQLGSYQYMFFVFAGGYPYLEPDVNLRAEVKGMAVKDDIKCDPADLGNFTLPEYWTAFSPSSEEASELSQLLTDINTYINEARPKFLSGQYNFTTDWDKYVSDLGKIGSARYLEIKQAQYDRYAK